MKMYEWENVKQPLDFYFQLLLYDLKKPQLENHKLLANNEEKSEPLDSGVLVSAVKAALYERITILKILNRRKQRK